MKSTVEGSNNSGTKEKVKEEENATLASKGQQEQRRRKVVSKIKFFSCGELGHYATQCPLRKRDKEERQDQQAASANIDKLSSKLEEEFSMITEIPPGVRWGDLVL